MISSISFFCHSGRKLDNIVTSISQTIDELVFRQPSLLILDHFDDLLPNETTMTDANLILATQKLALCKQHEGLLLEKTEFLPSQQSENYSIACKKSTNN